MKKLANVSILLWCIGFVWCIVIFYQHLDVILTPRQNLILYWKPVLLEFISYFAFLFFKSKQNVYTSKKR
jgi:hypothetical protein